MQRTLLIVDREDQLLDEPNLPCITFEQYLSDYPKLNEPRTRIISLCDTRDYLSRGYYCSLLAEARQHKVLPSVGVINDLRVVSTKRFGLGLTLPSNLLKDLPDDEHAELLVYFGWVADERWKKLARHIFDNFPAPILQLKLSRSGGALQITVHSFAFADLDTDQRQQFLLRLRSFTEHTWRKPTSQKKTRWDLAILINPDEKQPPSDEEAIQRFVKAAAKIGINAETIRPKQASQITQYDALFIRETTGIDHHTYRIARRAEQEGLVVIDDPTSILRCCNKVFLHDAFTYNKVPALRTKVVIDASPEVLDDIERNFNYPMVVKTPEGSFSKGVFKVSTREELQDKLKKLFQETALVLIQEYLYTDYDWRIGVLNGRAIYACQYHMARNHWQIYNHDSKRFSAGGFETLPTFEVPRKVLDAAVKASSMIGDGLYGVDIKQKDNHVYVIEVNDNPSIDHNVEDHYLGNELYMQIMSEFARRLEQRGR